MSRSFTSLSKTFLISGLKKGAIAGIAVGSIFGVVFIIAGVIAIVR